MSLLPFLVVTIAGAVAAFLLRGAERWSSLVGTAALVAATVAALLIRPGEVVAIGGAGWATTEYLRLFLILGCVVGLLLAVVGAATARHRDASTVTLGILATTAVALALPDARLAILAATAAGTFGALLAIGAGHGRTGASVGIRALRAAVVAGTMAIAATAWIGRDLSELAAQPSVFGLAYLAVAIAVAVRFGAIPFHGWAARLTDTTPETTLPLVTALAPATFAVVALAWADASVAPLLVDLGAVRAVVLAVAVASITLAAVAAWIQDDVEHVVGYSIIGDAGVILLAVAALDPEAWAPARTWILAFIVTRAAFAAWAAATRSVFATGRLTELRGWAIRAPVLTVIFATVLVASIGLPGLAVFDARLMLVDLAVDGPLVALLSAIAVLAPLAIHGRLLAIGLARPSGERSSPVAWRPAVGAVDLTDALGWARRNWDANRALGAAAGALLLGIVALVVAFGGLGVPRAASGLPPSLEGASESFAPEGPLESEIPVETDPPAASEEPGASASDDPSFAPVKTP